MVFNKKAYSRRHKDICRSKIPHKNNVKNCNKILKCQFDNCMQEIINLETTIPPIDEICPEEDKKTTTNRNTK